MSRLQKIFFFVVMTSVVGCATAKPTAPPAPVASVSTSITPLFDSLVTHLIKEAPSLVKQKIAVGDLTEMSGQKTPRGAFLKEKFIESLTRVGPVPLVERSQIDSVVQELKLSMSGYIDEQSEKTLGKMLGADGLITGTITELGETLELVVRVIRTETGEILAVGAAEIPNDQRMQQLNSQVSQPPDPNYRPPLSVRMNLIAQRQTAPEEYQDILVQEGAVLRSGDNLQVHFSTNADCYVYILMLNASGEASQLFPDANIAISNQVKGNQEYHVPPGNDWFFLDNQTGTETIYLLASYKPMTDMASILAKMGQGGEGQKASADQLKKGVNVLMRGMGERPPKPIRITGTLGHSSQPEYGMRGLGGVRSGPDRTFVLGNGQTIRKATEIVEGYASVVRVVSFQHKE